MHLSSLVQSELFPAAVHLLRKWLALDRSTLHSDYQQVCRCMVDGQLLKYMDLKKQKYLIISLSKRFAPNSPPSKGRFYFSDSVEAHRRKINIQLRFKINIPPKFREIN